MVLHEPRYVIDTNVLISALLFTNSTPARAFALAQDQGKVLVSAPFLRELQDVLGRPKFEAYISSVERNQFLTTLVREATLVTVTVELRIVRDPMDVILELAVSGGATAIMSGDPDLLALRSYDSIPIRKPADFLRLEQP